MTPGAVPEPIPGSDHDNDNDYDNDYERVTELLGRRPQGAYEVVVRRADGWPVVIANAPLLDSGRPMPTRYWLIDKALNKAIGTLEATGAVDRVEAELGPDVLRAVHDAYAAERDDLLPDDHTGPAPSGGVGGTRIGVKCLHAHYAYLLAGGDDPVGRWVHDQLMATGDAFTDQDPAYPGPGRFDPVDRIGTDVVLDLGADEMVVARQTDDGTVERFVVPLGPAQVTATWLHGDPPSAAELSAAQSVIELYLTDLKREAPALAEAAAAGPVAGRGLVEAIARVEIGETDPTRPLDGATLRRGDVEDLFRTVATENAADRAFNPGLEPGFVDDLVGALCLLLEFMRRLGVDELVVSAGPRATS